MANVNCFICLTSNDRRQFLHYEITLKKYFCCKLFNGMQAFIRFLNSIFAPFLTVSQDKSDPASGSKFFEKEVALTAIFLYTKLLDEELFIIRCYS